MLLVEGWPAAHSRESGAEDEESKLGEPEPAPGREEQGAASAGVSTSANILLLLLFTV